jgi:hypothetical protein
MLEAAKQKYKVRPQYDEDTQTLGLEYIVLYVSFLG